MEIIIIIGSYGKNMSSWFSTRQINIILSYQHICNNQIIWRMFQCVGQHRYLFSVSSLIMEAILASDVVPLSECLLLQKENFQNTVIVLPSRVRKVHWSALPEYSDRSLQSTSMNSQLLFNSNRITILVIYNCTKFLHCRNCFLNNSISALGNESTKNEFHMLLLR